MIILAVFCLTSLFAVKMTLNPSWLDQHGDSHLRSVQHMAENATMQSMSSMRITSQLQIAFDRFKRDTQAELKEMNDGFDSLRLELEKLREELKEEIAQARGLSEDFMRMMAMSDGPSVLDTLPKPKPKTPSTPPPPQHTFDDVPFC